MHVSIIARTALVTYTVMHEFAIVVFMSIFTCKCCFVCDTFPWVGKISLRNSFSFLFKFIAMEFFELDFE